MTKEQKFYKALQDVFIGARIEGKGGFVNLMRIKSNYYRKIEDILKKDIETALKTYPSFRDELFDKLYSFFSRYFTESGSIYFNSTPFHNNIYEKVYTDEKDVILFWKTQMLYYVKTDRIFRSLPVEFPSDRGVDAKGGQGAFKFYFDATKIENKKANEKRSLIFELNKIHEDDTIVFDVQYSEKGRKTKQDDILRAIKKKGIAINEEQLERAFRVFEKQSEVDFFINKNAKAFLQEQFKLWSYQYFWEGAKEWSADRVNELQILKDIAFKIIDFISQFEDELVKIWNKPKFVKNSNYVITLDRIKDISLVENILKHKNINEQIKEWQELGIVDENFKLDDIFTIDLMGKHLSEKYQHLPIDTKYFKDLELEILSQFEDLDKALDGWLIKSENYQALNTILPKFKEKVHTIYIDPPFNTGDDFEYVDRFQDSTWLSLIYDRLKSAKYLLLNNGSIFLHLDRNADYYGRFLLQDIFESNSYKNDIIWKYFVSGKYPNEFAKDHDRILFYAKTPNSLFNYEKEIDSDLYYEKKAKGETVIKDGVEYYVYNGELRTFEKQIGETWNINKVKRDGRETFGFNTQKPEDLLKRIVKVSSQDGSIVLDYFLGIGTTIAVAHKMRRKWIGIEIADHFNTMYIDQTGAKKIGIVGRMKEVLAGQGNHEPCGISKEVNWQGGGFFKYYELEQYEEALANCKYEDGDLFNSPSKTPYQEYVFMKDEKMLECMEIDYENNKVKVDLDKLYPNIDIAETLSNLTGKWIKKITPLLPIQEGNYELEFEDGTKIDTKDLDYKLIKPLIWWE